MINNDKGVRLPVQEIVDLFYIEKNYEEMTKQIDRYGGEGFDNYWTELAVDMETYINHEEDYSIFQNMVIQYTWVKEEQREDVEKQQEEKSLYLIKQFANYLITDFDLLDIDIKNYDFTESISDFLDSNYIKEKA